MSVGALIYRLRKSFRGGLHTSYYREIVRPRILKTCPIVDTNDMTCEIHALTSADDWLNVIWTLKSFYLTSKRFYSLCIHDDGTLTKDAQQELMKHFPNARLIVRTVADHTVPTTLAGHPRCQEFRKTNVLSPKLFDFAAFLETDRMLMLDSDVLFFAEPTALLRRIEDPRYKLNCVNRDVASAYTIEPHVAADRTGVKLIERFNAGFGLIHRQSLQLDWIEEFLKLPDVLSHFFRTEQTLFALCSSRFGVELLPPDYDVRLTGGIEGRPSRHYVGAIRQLMYKEGVRHLVKQGLFDRVVGSRESLHVFSRASH